ncbi:hypothetical protein N7532_005009 [Penicillium argentinense]|uniref:Uncharacterized protein n=1 Tax=Penicillium argentinense TaxID=1131581 RepID=A0A9W9K9I2_9EURO|nr:uncharacterized protein N7532_005009 [Penicillium argentinense]KAJ5098008.1 hypothetical protein N7532_005009 [Penicillium argentinense]
MPRADAVNDAAFGVGWGPGVAVFGTAFIASRHEQSTTRTHEAHEDRVERESIANKHKALWSDGEAE